jgi:hypothetical protein
MTTPPGPRRRAIVIVALTWAGWAVVVLAALTVWLFAVVGAVTVFGR